MPTFFRRRGAGAAGGPAGSPARRGLVAAIVSIMVLALVVVVGGGTLLSGAGSAVLRTVGSSGSVPRDVTTGKVDVGSGYGTGSTSTGTTGSSDGSLVAGELLAPDTKGVPVPVTDGVDGSLLVRTGTMEVEIGSIDDALAAARTAITGLGGFISNSAQSAADAERPYATITYRVPAAKWDEALRAIHGLGGTVKAERTEAVEVTGTVKDLGARITNLRASESALVAIMLKAVKIEDVLAVQAQLTSVRGEIEQLSTEKARLERLAAYGTLSVTFSKPVAAVTEASQQWNPGAQVDEALAALVSLGQAIAGGAIWLAIVGIPLLALAAAIGLGVYFVARRTGRRPTPDAAA